MYANLKCTAPDCPGHGGDSPILGGCTGHNFNLRGADLTGANLRGANLRGANLYGAIGIHRLPVSDSRGYTWLAVMYENGWRIIAGCRSFSIAEARAHWLADDYAGPAEVRETVGFALDWIEKKQA